MGANDTALCLSIQISVRRLIYKRTRRHRKTRHASLTRKKLRVQRDAAYVEYDAAFQDYKEVVLKALQSVADAMTAIDQGASALRAYGARQARCKTLLGMIHSQL